MNTLNGWWNSGDYGEVRMSRRLFGVLFALALLALSGCAGNPLNRFTLEVDLPAQFRFIGAANYVPATGQTCTLPQRRGKRPERKIFIAQYKPVAGRVSYELPLTETIEGCPSVLRSVELDIYAKWGERYSDVGGDITGFSVRDRADAEADRPDAGVQELQGQCQWLFRTSGPKHTVIKVLTCSALRSKAQAGGVVERDHLSGRALRVTVALSNEERPYFGNTWVRVPQGWRRCLGRGLADQYGFCRGEDSEFRVFQMPDGRECRIYPTCTE